MSYHHILQHLQFYILFRVNTRQYYYNLLLLHPNMHCLLVFDLKQRIEEERGWRDDIALGVVALTPDVKLEPWEIWEARAEVAGFGA